MSIHVPKFQITDDDGRTVLTVNKREGEHWEAEISDRWLPLGIRPVHWFTAEDFNEARAKAYRLSTTIREAKSRSEDLISETNDIIEEAIQ